MSRARNVAKLAPNSAGILPATNVLSGTVIQVVQAIKTDPAVVSGGTTYTIASVSIAPTFSTSRFLLMSHVNGYQTYDTNLYWTRNGTVVGAGDALGNRARGFGEISGAQRSNEQGNAAGFFIDSPATTSVLTYSLLIFNTSTTAYINRSAADDNANYDSRTTSTITVLEIK